MWRRFKDCAHKVPSATMIKSHATWPQADKAGIPYGFWHGNKGADELAGESADAHGYSRQTNG